MDKLTKSIVISGPPAVGKTTIARGIAEEFDLKFLAGGDLLKEMANELGFDTKGDDWWDTEEGMSFLSERKKNPEFDKNLDEKLKEIFLKDNVVITSYTIPWIVDHGIKIWLDGSLENSAKRMRARDNVSVEESSQIAKKRYDENKTIYKQLYGFEFGKDLSVFHKIIKTDDLNASEVLKDTINAIKELL